MLWSNWLSSQRSLYHLSSASLPRAFAVGITGDLWVIVLVKTLKHLSSARSPVSLWNPDTWTPHSLPFVPSRSLFLTLSLVSSNLNQTLCFLLFYTNSAFTDAYGTFWMSRFLGPDMVTELFQQIGELLNITQKISWQSYILLTLWASRPIFHLKYIYICYIYIILEPFHKVQTSDSCSAPGIWQIYGLKTGWWLCGPHSLPSFSTHSREVDQITLKLTFFRSYIRNIRMQWPELYLSQIMSTHLKGSPYLIQL